MCPKRYKYSGFSDYQEKHVFFVEWPQWDSRRVQGGLQKWGGRPSWVSGSPRESSSGPLGPFLGGPGFAKRSQGLTFDVNPWGFLMISCFALNVFWKVLRGSWKRGERQSGAQGEPKRTDRFFVVAPGRPKSEQAWKRWLLEKEVPEK